LPLIRAAFMPRLRFGMSITVRACIIEINYFQILVKPLFDAFDFLFGDFFVENFKVVSCTENDNEVVICDQ